MTKKLVLCEPSILVSGLSYEKAGEVLRKAGDSKASEFFRFSMVGKDHSRTWSIEAHPIHATRAFVKNPGDFVIEYEEEKKDGRHSKLK